MRKLFRFLRSIRFRYKPLVEVQISRARILHNLTAYQKRYPTFAIAPVLKSNAYGHGLVQVGTILKDQNVPFLVVDSYYEALIVRNEGIKLPILTIGYVAPDNIAGSKLAKVAYTITSVDALKALGETVKKQVTIHLKIDTGMCRQGIMEHEISQVFEILGKHPHIILEGICSHLADSENEDAEFTHKQIDLWNSMVKRFTERFTLKYTHISATHGAFHAERARANVVRLGIGLYGISMSSERDHLNLLPALEMRTIVTSVKKIPQGAQIGYNGTYTAQTPMTVATLPLGYFEGIDRELSNKGCVSVDGVYCPIVGRVSMNITTIDVNKVPQTKIGSVVTVVSRDEKAKNSLASLAKSAGTIPYVIMVHIPQSLHRIVVD